jgi:hypothetical protein
VANRTPPTHAVDALAAALRAVAAKSSDADVRSWLRRLARGDRPARRLSRKK